MTRRLKTVGLMALLTLGAFGQMPSKGNEEVHRIGMRLACQCGCSDTVASCKMPGCHFAEPARDRLRELLAAGVGESQILDEFVKKYGAGILRGEPSSLGWAVPYLALGLGLLMIYLFVKRYYRQPAPLAEVPSADPRYQEQIEKELANLE